MLDVNWPCADTSPANVLLSAAAVVLASKTSTTPIPLDGIHRIMIAVGQRALELLIVHRTRQVDREGIPSLALTPHGGLELHLPSRDLSGPVTGLSIRVNDRIAIGPHQDPIEGTFDALDFDAQVAIRHGPSLCRIHYRTASDRLDSARQTCTNEAGRPRKRIVRKDHVPVAGHSRERRKVCGA